MLKKRGRFEHKVKTRIKINRFTRVLSSNGPFFTRRLNSYCALNVGSAYNRVLVQKI